MTEPRVLTKQDLQRILHISERTLENRVRAGAIPPPQRLGGRRVYWEVRAFNAWLTKQLELGEPPIKRYRGRPRKTVDSDS